MKLYKCEICGNIIEKVIDKGVPVMCCGKPMVELTANTSDGALEKHVPQAAYADGVLKVSVGSVAHPMLEEHSITNIWVIAGNKVMRADLKPGEAPEASFAMGDFKGKAEVYDYVFICSHVYHSFIPYAKNNHGATSDLFFRIDMIDFGILIDCRLQILHK